MTVTYDPPGSAMCPRCSVIYSPPSAVHTCLKDQEDWRARAEKAEEKNRGCWELMKKAEAERDELRARAEKAEALAKNNDIGRQTNYELFMQRQAERDAAQARVRELVSGEAIHEMNVRLDALYTERQGLQARIVELEALVRQVAKALETARWALGSIRDNVTAVSDAGVHGFAGAAEERAHAARDAARKEGLIP